MKQVMKQLREAAEAKVTPCPMCSSDMSCHNTADISGESQKRTHFVLACNECGFGPAQAFDTQSEAVSHWNNTADNYASNVIECL